MPALEPINGVRAVAQPDALDAAAWEGADVVVLRVAPDEVFAIGATSVSLADPDAIVEPEASFSAVTLDLAGVAAVSAHVDWSLDAPIGGLVQGKIAGVPAKLLRGDDTILVVQTAYADELERRLGWR